MCYRSQIQTFSPTKHPLKQFYDVLDLFFFQSVRLTVAGVDLLREKNSINWLVAGTDLI